MRIRRAEDRDRAAIARIHAASWADTYRGTLPDSLLDETLPAIMAERWAKQVIAPADAVLVAEDEAGEILGFGATWDGEPVYVDNLHVAAHARSQGIGRLILAETARHFLGRHRKGALLHVVAANGRARAFYLALGGRPDGIEDKDLYGTLVPNARIVWDDLAHLCRAQGCDTERASGRIERMTMQDMTARVAEGKGFIAALDQSGGSTPKALKGYGIEEGAWSSDEEMFGLIHRMRSRIITSPAFTGDKVLGAILFERTMDGEIEGKPVPEVLIERGVVPFIKIDKGLEAEADGVQLMKPMPELDALLGRARGLGVFGTKERSVINLANRAGIHAVVAQQFEVAKQVLAAGLVPIIEPEVNIKSPERAGADAILLDELVKALDALPGDDKVMLKLSLPVEPGLFDPLVAHPRVLRVVALSGGYARPEACAELAKNKGVIASFSRALLDDLRHGMTDAEFDAALGEAIDDIYRASTVKA